jgi:ATP-dependent Clp protease ATP-binding subunit ClpC
LLREDQALAIQLLHGIGRIEELRNEIVSRKPARTKVSTSVDLPLGEEVREALALANEEADRLKHNEVGTRHVVVGLLLRDKCFAAELLRGRGITLEQARTDLASE